MDGAKSIYNEIYHWKAELTANTSLSSSTSMSSISKYDPIYIHFKITDGPPLDTTKVTAKYTLPDGTGGVINMGARPVGDFGTLEWEKGLYTNPAYGKTGTFSLRFYDGDGNQIGTVSVRITN